MALTFEAAGRWSFRKAGEVEMADQLQQPDQHDPLCPLFEASAAPMLLADDDRRYVDANPAACELLGRTRAELRRLRVDDVSPPGVDVEAVWRRLVVEGDLRGEYTLTRPGGATVEVEFQATANVFPGQHLSVLQDVTARKSAERDRDASNLRLREAHDRARRVALTLQRAMLPNVVSVPGLEVAVRYIPASDVARVGGDWFDIAVLEGPQVGVAVGDVMGHGLAASGIMGQLRSALAAAMHASSSPARAMGILDTYARRTAHDDMFATALAGVVDLERREFTYSSAGHPPAVLLDGGIRLLNDATDPPLSATPRPQTRREATVKLGEDVTLVLYTDGLIEQRGEDIDKGLRRLADSLSRVGDQGCEMLADALLDELIPSGETDDDVALVVIRL